MPRQRRLEVTEMHKDNLPGLWQLGKDSMSPVGPVSYLPVSYRCPGYLWAFNVELGT